MSNMTPARQLATTFEQWKPTLRAILPRHLDADRIIKIAVSSFARNPTLQQCSLGSVIQAVIVAAELGLEPGSYSGEAYLVPFKGKATLIPGYKGLIKLAKQHGDVVSVSAYCVDESDLFEVELGLEPRIVHKPNLTGRTGKLKAVYAIARMKDGGFAFDFMLPAEVEAIRIRSRGGSSGPWQTDYHEMAKKTVIKRMLKLLPMSAERPELATAIAASYAGETGDVVLTPTAEMIEDEVLALEAPKPQVSLLTSAIQKGADK